MDKDLEHAREEKGSLAGNAPVAHSAASRRKFTRNAVAGSAVLFSLGNRAAWGKNNNAEETCISAAMLTSFVANGRQFASLRPGQSIEAAKAEEILKPKHNKTRFARGNQVCVQPVGPGESVDPGDTVKPGLPGLPTDL